MKMSKHRSLKEIPDATRCPKIVDRPLPGHRVPPLPILVAGVFAKLRIAQRVRVLRRLLMSVGPMALAVLGSGAFAKFVVEARWPRMSISLDDAARITSSQMFELVRYVEQSNPQALQQVMAFLARDAASMAAVGASVALVATRHLANRKASRGQSAWLR
jgi:hypothetical protein